MLVPQNGTSNQFFGRSAAMSGDGSVAAASTIRETDGLTQATVSRNTIPTGDLVIGLTSSPSDEASFPSYVTIPAGSLETTFAISAVEDGIVDGAQEVLITAAADSHADASDSMTVLDDNTPELTLRIDETGISENKGSAQVTVSRNTDTSRELLVLLSSSDLSELTVPRAATIRAGETEVSFAVSGVDDSVVDGDQLVTVTAVASGHTDASSEVQVEDDDVSQLTLVIHEDSINERNGSSLVTVLRNTPPDEELSISLSTSDTSELVVPDSFVFPAGFAAGTFSISAADDQIVDGLQSALVIASAASYLSGSDTILVADDDAPRLTLTIEEDEFSENGGSSRATVTRNTDTATDMVVTLASSDTSEAITPATVTIPAGASSTSFIVDAVDDTVLDGSILVTVSASSPLHSMASDSVSVTDDEHPELTLTIEQEFISENGGVSRVTVTRNSDTFNRLIVSLESSDPSEVSVPDSVTIPADQTSVSFTLAAVDDQLVDGTQVVSNSASATNHQDASDSLNVTDDDVPELTLVVDVPSIDENGGQATGTVFRNTESSDALVVAISSSEVDRATVAETVTIPAGEDSVQFAITAVDNELVEGDIEITFTASASSFVTAQATVLILEDDAWSWTNVINPFDVNEDDFVSPIDAFLVIDYLNNSQEFLLPPLTAKPFAYIDVNSDGFATPLDALLVINELNQAAGEGEVEHTALQSIWSELDLERERRLAAIDRYFAATR